MKLTPKIAVAGVVLLAAAVAGVISAITSVDSRTYSAAPSFRPIMQRFVLTHLRSPSSAEFAPSDEWHEKILSRDKHRLIGWVDAANGFGVKMRNSFVGYLTRDGDDYRLDAFEFLDWNDSRVIARVADIYDERNAPKPPPPPAVDAEAERQQQESIAIEQHKNKEFDRLLKQQNELMAKARSTKPKTFRQWGSGEVKIVARLASYENGIATVITKGGQQVQLIGEQLSDEDTRYLDGR